MSKPDLTIINGSAFKRVLFFLLGAVGVWGLCGTDFLSQSAVSLSLEKGIFSPVGWKMFLGVCTWGLAAGACITAVLPCRVKISPQYIQGPINIRPVLWKEIKRVDCYKMHSTVILVFHLKEGCSAQLRILHIFPAEHSSFSLALSTYSAKGQKDILEAVKKYSILGTNK